MVSSRGIKSNVVHRKPPQHQTWSEVTLNIRYLTDAVTGERVVITANVPEERAPLPVAVQPVGASDLGLIMPMVG